LPNFFGFLKFYALLLSGVGVATDRNSGDIPGFSHEREHVLYAFGRLEFNEAFFLSSRRLMRIFNTVI